jgi:hypothetical protein
LRIDKTPRRVIPSNPTILSRHHFQVTDLPVEQQKRGAEHSDKPDEISVTRRQTTKYSIAVNLLS